MLVGSTLESSIAQVDKSHTRIRLDPISVSVGSYRNPTKSDRIRGDGIALDSDDYGSHVGSDRIQRRIC
ncbi:unnamed protein product [Adineta ricciae]|uniref:Uncharacterized protein n=1 Tax=Adineta ricciae TaxID=249248 RepID=A0A815U6U2_ADIRI|nr:unnamed protein product [Adineta ricciae]